MSEHVGKKTTKVGVVIGTDMKKTVKVLVVPVKSKAMRKKTIRNKHFVTRIGPIFVFFAISLSSISASASTDCDKAYTLLSKGRFTSSREEAHVHYREAIKLCPGFIRPYELVGNYYRKKGEKQKAIEYFTEAAELGTTNYKLYYLLASLLHEEGDVNEASKYLKKSLNIKKDYQRALELKKRIAAEADTEGPNIILFEPAAHRGIKIFQRYASITVRGIATDKSGIAWIRINETDTPFDESGNFLKDIPIKTGTNTIVVVTADSLGNRSKLSTIVEGRAYKLPLVSKVEYSEHRKEIYSKSLAIVIGIDNYEKWPVLEFAAADAKAVKQRLHETGFDHIITILNEEATQRRILTELFYELPKEVGHHDRVFFYFAGHGQTEESLEGEKMGYIIPVDGDMSNYSSTAISMEQVRSLSKRIPAKHILYVMDSCYSGLGLNRSAGVSPKISDYVRKVASMRVVQIITAGGNK